MAGRGNRKGYAQIARATATFKWNFLQAVSGFPLATPFATAACGSRMATAGFAARAIYRNKPNANGRLARPSTVDTVIIPAT